MTEQPRRELNPAEEERVRTALSAARVTEPMPEPVVARLDAVLADLGAGRADTSARREEDRAPVLLASRRPRRSRWILAAGAASAAAVVALSVPGLRTLGTSGGSAGSAESGGSEASTSDAREKESPQAARGYQAASGTPRLTRQNFQAGVRRLLGGDLASLRDPASSPGATSDAPNPAYRVTCGAATALPGVVRRIPVLLDRTPAVLEVFGTRDGSREVRAVSCDGAETLASTRVPDP